MYIKSKKQSGVTYNISQFRVMKERELYYKTYVTSGANAGLR